MASKIKEIVLTPIQQAIFDKCEPLLQSAFDHNAKWARTLVEKCIEDVKKRWKEEGVVKAGDLKHKSYSAYQWTMDSKVNYHSHMGRLVNCSIDTNAPFMACRIGKDSDKANIWIVEPRFDKYLAEYNEYYKEWITFKLKRSIDKYVTANFTEIHNITIHNGTEGYEIFATLIDNTGKEFTFHTRAIGAGGYNIQEYHYRYITKIKEKI